MRVLAFVVGLMVLATARALAGPPFVTDDPEPTDYRNWEIYGGFQYGNDGLGGTSASAPFAEFNYGVLPNVQVSFSTQLSDERAPGSVRYGFGPTEFGLKTRFVQESAGRPQVSFYPSIMLSDVPGARPVVFLPLWMQKSYGSWTAFGGGGVYLNSAPPMRDSTFVGAALERTLSSGTTIGAELFHQSSDAIGGSDLTAAGVGAIFPAGRLHAILFSVNRALHGNDAVGAYASYEFALGPQK